MKLFIKTKNRYKAQNIIHNSMNKGFSLIEVLIAMVILAIITLPILSSFASAAKINSNARKQENANAVAQKVIEQFKALPISKLTAVNADGENKEIGVAKFTTEKALKTVDKDKLLIYTFKMASFGDDGKPLKESGEPYYVGANGEKFFVQVTLDPTSYAEKATPENPTADNKANNINSYDMPAIEDVSTDSNYVIAQQLYNHDLGIITAFSEIGVTGIDYTKIRREVTINSKVESGASVPVTTGKNSDGSIKSENINTYKQSLTLEVKYVVKADPTKSIVYTYDDHTFAPTNNIILNSAQINKLNPSTHYNEFKKIYIFYSAFDKYNLDITHLADDKVNIKYDYPSNPSDPSEITKDKQNLNVYLVEQNVSNQNSVYASLPESDRMVHMNKDNVQLYVNDTNPITKTIKGTLNLGNSTNTGAVNIYSNIYQWDQFISSVTQKNNITQSTTSSDTKSLYLYNIKVEIWAGEKTGNAFLTMTSTKEN